jgi:hypothetical protein
LLPAEMVLLNVWLTTEVLILAAWVKIFSMLGLTLRSIPVIILRCTIPRITKNPLRNWV